MNENTFSSLLNTDEATAMAAETLGQKLEPGDTLLLTGPVGAGKTHFARHLIQSILTTPEDIPSPTFTLVQTYETRLGPLWHTDLYRITSLEEIEELGLTEAFGSAICLVEWPDRLGPLRPENALDIALDPGLDYNSRMLRAQWQDAKWSKKTEAWAA